MLDIDHVVPLKEAHESGGWAWSHEQKKAFYNDLENFHLMAVYRGANRSKGERSPDQWMPPNESFRCGYLTIWVAVKKKYKLEMDPAERSFLEKESVTCGYSL